MTAGLPLMKSALTSLAKIVFLPSGLSAAMPATDAANKKEENSWIRNYIINNFKWINRRHNENI